MYKRQTNGIPTPQNAEANVIYTSQEDVIQMQIELAQTMADVVVVGVHWGTENSHVVNDAQRALAQKIADWGADIIIGTHPHVVQTIEMLTLSLIHICLPYISLNFYLAKYDLFSSQSGTQ